MERSRGAQLATLLLTGFEAMVADVVADLAAQGHPGVTATHEFALRAVGEGAQSASELGRRLGVTKQAAAKTIATLEELGYVERRTDPRDARRKTLTVTDRGREMVTVGARAFDRLRDTLQAEVGAERLAVAESVLERIADARQPAEAAGDPER